MFVDTQAEQIIEARIRELREQFCNSNLFKKMEQQRITTKL